MKKITYYMVIDNNKEYEDTRYYTFCQSREDCEEFINQYLILKHGEHYLAWCKLRKLNSKSVESWKLYKTTLELDKTFLIVKVKNTLNNVLSAVRSATCCPVIGCSYETDFDRRRVE